MGRSRQQAALVRQWRLVTLLHATKAGRTIAQLREALPAARATVYRDLTFLEQAGVAFASDVVNGEKRYRLLADPLPGLVSPARRHAMALACEALGAFKGTKLFRELEKIRDEQPEKSKPAPIAVGNSPAIPREQILSVVERALSESRVLTLRYRGASDAATRTRDVAPLELRLAKSQVYLLANEVETDAQRTFKIARIEDARLGDTFDKRKRAPAPMNRAVVAWSGDVVEVAVRISAEGARFVGEFALIQGQRVEEAPGGAVVVRAEVAGIEEALKWVLSWGRKAEVLSPPELRKRVKEELRQALGGYAEQGVSRKVRQGRGKVVAGEKQRAGAMNGVNRNHGFVARKAI